MNGPGIGKEVAHFTAAGLAGELVEHVAEVRQRVERVPRRTRAPAQDGRGLEAAVTADVQPVAAADRGAIQPYSNYAGDIFVGA